ncbi:MAG: FlgD immunoglobulin-like domain containing protein [Actinomycetes bacterium]
MRQRLGLVIVLALAAVAAAAPGSSAATVMAAPGTTPTITAPLEGDSITTPSVNVTATSSAASVRFVVGGLAAPFTVDAAVVTGTASADIPVSGVDGASTISAYDCDGLGACNAAGTSINVTFALTAPVVTSPSAGTVVGTSVTVHATSTSGSVGFKLDGVQKTVDTSSPFSATLSLTGQAEGPHTVSVVLCDAAGTTCQGPNSNGVDVVKDTQGPSWSALKANPSTFFPYRDGYRDTTRLSARVAGPAGSVRVDIRSSGGAKVQHLDIGAVSRGLVTTTWNGRTSKGSVAKPGTYSFRFVGTDQHGVVGVSAAAKVVVSDDRLVKKTGSRSVTAVKSFLNNLSGDCSGVFKLGSKTPPPYWSGGAGYYSNVSCRGQHSSALAGAVHGVAVPSAIRYGKLRIDTYGGAAQKHGGTAAIFYVRPNGDLAAGRTLGTAVGWHRGATAGMSAFVSHRRVYWVAATVGGHWYNIKSFTVRYSYFVLRSP